MGALAASSDDRLPAGAVAANEWAELGADAPQLAATMNRYLAQAATALATSLDTTSPVGWIGVANAELADHVLPAISAARTEVFG